MLHFPELWCPFASSVTFHLSLEDLIQGLRDSSWVLVEGWEADASGGMKSQVPSLEICMQVRKQQLELDMEQQTGSQ